MQLNEFLLLYPIAENREEVDEQLKNLPRPYVMLGKAVPENLNEITLGELIMLQHTMTNAPNDYERIKGCALIILHKDITEDITAEHFFGFGMWVVRELQRISKLFESLKSIPSEEERQAGIERLNFGFFGTLDWYCRRMGITDHSDAEKVPWVRVYKCMEIDSKTNEYERRLRKIYAQKKA